MSQAPSSSPLRFQVGFIYEVDDVQSLDNPEERKPRPVLVLHLHGSSLTGVAITGTPNEDKLDRGKLVEMPDDTRYPTAQSGLDRQSWAVPWWILSPVMVCRVDPRSRKPISTPLITKVWDRLNETVEARRTFRIGCAPDALTHDGRCLVCESH